ncbi:MAG: ThiF family adenylyltransferase [Abitibacteriaceae bacterium]|nr:ThiF family adenylyltransferase [Abditibacteriaceae bacterium]
MSQKLINHSPDLKRLRDEGYDIAIVSNLLVVRNIPYLNSRQEIMSGTLVDAALSLAGDVTARPETHTIYFAGEQPCHADGTPLNIAVDSARRELAVNLTTNYQFSRKPAVGYYENYYEKITSYVTMLLGPAQAFDPQATAQGFPPYETAEEESVFRYMDTASSRAEINIVAEKLALESVAIVGLGGTGSYVLDLVAKTPIKAIHLFDGDDFLSHNAFRCPGAASLEELRQKPKKAAYLRDKYSQMHRNIIAHEFPIDASTVQHLQAMSFVFLCMEGAQKRLIVNRLEEWNLPFVDVGMGVELVEGALIGLLRVTTSTPAKRDHVSNADAIPFAEDHKLNEYDQNIQIADLNALNATLAVIKWKKIVGFYVDMKQEHHTIYTVETNSLFNTHRAGGINA